MIAGSLWCALGVVGFIRGHWVHKDSPWRQSGSSGVAGFTGIRTGCRRFHPGSLGSLGCALGAIVVHPGSLGSLRCALLSIGFIWGDWVHWGAHRGPSGSSGISGFTMVRPGDGRVHPMVSSGSSGVAAMTGVLRGGRRVHPRMPG